MDLSATIIPRSDQINAEDLLAGPMTVTIESVTGGTAEQPVNVHLVETPGRAYRPSKTMRRVIVKAWGADSDAYIGRRMTLYRDADVKFGGIKVGGIKISHLSHIDKAFSLALTETKGKRTPHTVEPLPDSPKSTMPPAPAPSREDIAACTDVDQLNEWAATYQGPRRDAALARLADLSADADPWAGEAE